jgi:hypothetical protein
MSRQTVKKITINVPVVFMAQYVIVPLVSLCSTCQREKV